MVFPKPGLGECDTPLLYERMRSQGRACWILDGCSARRAAKKMGAPFTGLLGLLILLRYPCFQRPSGPPRTLTWC